MPSAFLILGAFLMLVITWWSIAVHGKGSWPVLLGANLLINGNELAPLHGQ